MADEVTEVPFEVTEVQPYEGTAAIAAKHLAKLKAEAAANEEPEPYWSKVGARLSKVPGDAKEAFEEGNRPDSSLLQQTGVPGLIKAVGIPFEVIDSFTQPAFENAYSEAAHLIGGRPQKDYLPESASLGEGSAVALSGLIPVPGLHGAGTALERDLGKATTMAEEEAARGVEGARTPVVDPDSGQTILKNPPAPVDSQAAQNQILKNKGVNPADSVDVGTHVAEREGIDPAKVNLAVDPAMPISRTEAVPGGIDVKIEPGTVGEQNTRIEHEIGSHGPEKIDGAPPPVEDNAAIMDGAIGKEAENTLPKYAGSVNLERLSTSQGVKQAIVEASNDVERAGPVSFKEMQEAAADIDLSPEDMTRMAEDAPKYRNRLLAARQLHLSAQEGYVETLGRWKAGQATNADLATALSSRLETFKAMDILSGEAGRALGMHKITVGGDIAQATKELDKVLAVLKDRGKLGEDVTAGLAKLDLDSAPKIRAFTRNLNPKIASLKDKIFEAYRASLLSGIKTQVVKTVGDLMMAAWKPVEASAAGVSSFGRSLFGANQERFVGEGPASFYGMTTAVPDAAKMFLNTLKSGLSNAAEMTGVDSVNEAQHLPAIGGTLGKVVRIPMTSLGAISDFFKAIHVQGSIYQQAYRKAAQEGLSGAELFSRVGDVAANPTSKMTKIANEEGLFRTFQADYGKWAKPVANLRQQVEPAKYIVPFFKTPLNIATFGIEGTPLSAVDIAYKIAKGTLKGGAIDDRVARMAMGATLGGMVAAHVWAGKMSGGGPVDPHLRETMQATGWQPYSIKTDTGWRSYNRAEPFGVIAGLSADAAELQQEFHKDEWDDFIGKLAFGASKNLLSKTYLQGLSDFVETIHDPSKNAPRTIGSLAGGFVPTIVANVASGLDPNLRDAQTILDRVRARVPVVREEVTPRYDYRGREIPAPGGSFADKMVDPFMESKFRGSKVDQIAAKIGEAIGPVSHYIKTPKGMLKLDDQKDYEQLQKLSGHFVDIYMKSIENNPSFEKATPAVQQEILKKYITAGRSAGEKQFIGLAAKAGKLKGYMDAAQQRKDKKTDNPYGNQIDTPETEEVDPADDPQFNEPDEVPMSREEP